MNAEVIRDQLISTAALRLDGLTKLVTLAEEQQAMLVGGKHSDLESNIRDHDLTLSELAQLDHHEAAMAEKLDDAADAALGLDDRYEVIARNTTDTCRKLGSLVHCNAELLDNAMQYVSFTLGLLSDLAAGQQSYDPKSDGAANSAAIMLDRKV